MIVFVYSHVGSDFEESDYNSSQEEEVENDPNGNPDEDFEFNFWSSPTPKDQSKGKPPLELQGKILPEAVISPFAIGKLSW